MKVAFLTLGCKVNQVETEHLISEAINRGDEVVDFDSAADVYIVNTCTVTAVADQKSRQMIRRALKHESARVIVTGCYANVAADEIRKIDPRIEIVSKDRDFPAAVSFHTRAFLKIEDGCENFCSYCIIPYARGKIRSKPLEQIRTDVENLVEHGTKEIVLTGIHLGAYGRDIKLHLSDAIKTCLEVKNLERLRLSSLESIEFTEPILDLFENPKLCRHLHLPLQSGSDKILRLMRRPYDRKKFSTLIYAIRKKIPRLTLTTDVIVGFPNESDDDFQDTIEFCQEMNFAKIHVFPFSPRPGTPAFEMTQVPPEIKKDRVERLLAVSNDLSKKFYEGFLNRTVSVLFEQKSGKFFTGHDEFYAKVFTSDSVELGKIRNVCVHSLHKDGILGRVV